MPKNELSKLRQMMKNIRSLGRTPDQASDEYFNQLQDKIMDQIEPCVDCCEVQESLVDLIEGTVSSDRQNKIMAHLDKCETCSKNYELTIKLMENTQEIKEVAPNSSYFEALPGRIEQRLFEEGVQTPCEKTRLYLADKLSEQDVPKDVEEHLAECDDCSRELIIVEKMMSSLKTLYIPSPSQNYFEKMLEDIDRKIEALPSHRIVPEYQKVSFKYLTDIFDALKTAFMHPYVAVALSAMITLVVIGGKFFSSPESIEEKQINLSDVISKSPTNVDDGIAGGINIYSTASRDAISDPTEDEKLQINTTGTAKKEDPKDKNKKLN